jgi:hypothetical protein
MWKSEVGSRNAEKREDGKMRRWGKKQEWGMGRFRKAEVGPAVVPNERDYGAAIDAASGP